MAIKSNYVLPASYTGKNWTSELLSKPGTRNGMKCIYKIRMNGDTKRAGLYISERKGNIIVMDVGGNKFVVDLVENTVKYQATTTQKYSSLADDDVFIEMMRLTLAHFGEIDDPTGLYKPPPPKVTVLSDEEASAIAGFGLF
jgi:hypothetical protein